MFWYPLQTNVDGKMKFGKASSPFLLLSVCGGPLDLVLEFMHRKFGLETKQALGHLVQSVLNCETLFKACHVPKALYPRYTHIATPFSQARLTHMLLILSNIMFGREE